MDGIQLFPLSDQTPTAIPTNCTATSSTGNHAGQEIEKINNNNN